MGRSCCRMYCSMAVLVEQFITFSISSSLAVHSEQNAFTHLASYWPGMDVKS